MYIYIYTYRQIDIERYIQIYYVIKTRTLVSLLLFLYIKCIYTWNLLRNPVEPDLSLHQSLPDLLRNLQHLPRGTTSQRARVVQTRGFFNILTSKCASRHKGAHIFVISTSKSGPTMKCFVHFDFEMCFAPQRRALFRHLNFQKCSENGVFCTFSLRNVLRATRACTFSTSQLPKVVRPWCALYMFTSKCASRHNGVQLFISHLARWLRTRRFSEPTFRRKNTVFRDFPFFSRICIFFDLLSSTLLFSLTLSICFSSVHIYCRKFDF